MADHDGAIWLDLCDEQWHTVEISQEGWQIFDGKPPVKFIRSRGMLALPEPVTGGSLDDLKPFLNVRDNDDFVLMVSWLMACLKPSGPYPILCLYGEQGSAKSTAGKLLRSLVDPNAAPLRAEPRENRDLAIAASNAWLLCFDNISYIRPWLSDAFCRLSTGGGFATRELFSNGEETIFDSQRPISLNGIEDIATRADLLDRAMTIVLPAIPEKKRQPESQLWLAFEQAQPRILGALLNAVSTGLKNQLNTKLEYTPRMADFAVWVSACEPALDWPRGTFMAAYRQNRATANTTAIEANIIGLTILSFMENKPSWSGTMKELLVELEIVADEKTKNAKSWPTSPRKLSGYLRRIMPNLRNEGINITIPGHTKRGTIVVLEKIGTTPSPSSLPSPEFDNSLCKKELDADKAGDDSCDGLFAPETSSPTSSPLNVCNNKQFDEGDEGDGINPAFTKGDVQGIRSPADLPESCREEYEERLAILEIDGGLSPEHAEAQAFAEVLVRING